MSGVVRRRLARGSTLLAVPMPHMESACIGVWALSGSRHEVPRENGIAHFAEHMLFKGTRSRDAAQLMREIEGVGGTIDAFTELDHTCYYARAEAAKLPGIAEVVFDLYARPSFPAAEVDREREVIADEIVMYQENPGQHVEDVLAAAVWPGSPLGRPITGTGESIGRLGRRELRGWVDRHHAARNTLVAVAGAVDVEEIARLAAVFDRRLGPGRRSVRRRFRAGSGGGGPAVAIDHRTIEQVNFALGFRCPGVSWELRTAGRVLGVILGENMSSRLFQCLRERHGLCYNIGTDFTASGEDGLFSVYAGVDPADQVRAIDLVVRELKRIASRPPSRREMAAAVDYAIGMMKLSLEGTADRMLWLGESFVAHGAVGDAAGACERLAAVTPAEVSAAAAAIFQPGNAAFAAVGPVGDDGWVARRLGRLASG